MPCMSMFMLPTRSIVWSKSKPWNMPSWKWARRAASVCDSGWCLRTYSEAATRKPAVPHAGSQISSVGVGAIRSTINAMMWRGVRNWPLTPADASLLSRYSYRSPLMSVLPIGISSTRSTTFDNSAGLWIVKRASRMCSA